MWNSVSDSHGYCDSHSDSYRYCNSNSNSYSYRNGYSYANSYRYLDPETHPDATVSAHSEGSSHSAAATVSLGSQVISCSHGSVSRVNALTSRRGDRYNLGVPSSRSTSKSKKGLPANHHIDANDFLLIGFLRPFAPAAP